jgi:hypothetical protein
MSVVANCKTTGGLTWGELMVRRRRGGKTATQTMQGRSAIRLVHLRVRHPERGAPCGPADGAGGA